MSDADARALAEIEAALNGDGTGAEAEYWRELRADVRALSEPVDPVFARALERRVRAPGSPRRSPRTAASALARRRGRVLAVAASLVAVLVAVLTVGSLTSSRTPGANPSRSAVETRRELSPRSNGFGPVQPVERATSGAAAAKGTKGVPQLEAGDRQSALPSATPQGAAGGETPGESGGRLQQLGASVTLNAGGEGVQQIADRVGRATVAAGGFVQSARVQTQQWSPGEAVLSLVLPSAKLQATLARLERIAPVRSESQSLQDITSQYDAATSRLAAARAERAALLRALARAESPAAIESLHARLVGAAHQVSAAERQQASVSRQASHAQVEVTVLGTAHHAGGGSTLERGLNDAGKVLTVSLAVLVVAAAVLLPLAVVLAAVVLGGRAWRRQRRERVLGSG
jgi:hypothetical protein